MWERGAIVADGTAFRYLAKVFDTGSVFGIGGGRISKLEIKRSGEVVAQYDRGWDIEPVDGETQRALCELLAIYEQEEVNRNE